MSKQNKTVYIRNFIFGVEDSLVSTVGLLSGVAAAGVAKQTIFLTGIVLIFVEALSMAVGSFLSEETVEDMDGYASNKRISFWGALTMFFSYFLAGFIPLFPYIVWDKLTAFYISIIASLSSLFGLGIVGSYFSPKASWQKKGLQMMLLGGAAIFAGVIVGSLVSSL